MLIQIPFAEVKIDDKFWNQKQEVNRKVTIAESYRENVDTGRVKSFKLDWKPGINPIPHKFWDSDVAKWLETACYSLHTHPDSDLRKMVEEVIDLIGSAQQKDGYLNVHYTIVEPELKWKNLKDNHELYCAGHLIEAAVAHYQATKSKKFLDIMCGYADYIDSVFGPEENKLKGYCGHEEIELALVKLYRVTKNPKYLNLSKYFVDERGQLPHYFMMEEISRGIPVDPNPFSTIKRYEYCQANIPVREQNEMVGHAVRAGYLYSAMADLALETQDQELFDACERIWNDAMLTKMYITGGIGSSRHNEGITTQYDLPNEDAYCETCAAIAMLFWNQRMLLYSLQSKYADVVERILYNGSISGVSLDGKLFFYENPLAITSKRRGFKRQKWYGCACCPNNLSRLIASLGSYIYSQGVDSAKAENPTPSIIIQQYIGNITDFIINGKKVSIELKSEFPWNGNVSIVVSSIDEVEFLLQLRIPDWCKKYTLKLNDKPIKPTRSNPDNGYISIIQSGKSKSIIQLNLDMSIERVHAHPSVMADVGRVALQRGPIVYCLEEEDNGSNIDSLVLPKSSEITAEIKKDLLGGIMMLKGNCLKLKGDTWHKKLYNKNPQDFEDKEFAAIPYYAWNNRKIGEMAVWLREI
jgi:DUF1680 family protein